jgi:hypothetical protein
MSLRLVVPGLALATSMVSCGQIPSSISFESVSPDHPQITDIATLVFKLQDYRGIPLAGSPVSFRLSNDTTKGVTLTPTAAVSDKGSGEVRVQVAVAGTASTVTVIADAGGGKVALSPPITFAGSFANGRQLTFQCGPFGGPVSGGIHALGAYDPARHLIDGTEVDCFAHVADKNGDGIPNAQVSFLTEAGAITPTATTSNDHEGAATVTYKVTYPLPRPTDKGSSFTWSPPNDDIHTGAYFVPLWMEPFNWTVNPLGTLLMGSPAWNGAQLSEPWREDPILKDNAGKPMINNPRDNLVTIIAFTNGEEGYTDANGNNRWDDGEPFDDLTEPFIDSNDNGTWDAPSMNCLAIAENETYCVSDPGEKFVDVNADTQWNGKNGQWDANTTIWVAERITWTGIPYNAGDLELRGVTDDYNGTYPVVKVAQIGLGSPAPPVRVHCNENVVFSFPISDPWWNTMAQNGQDDGCTAGQALGMKAVDAAGTHTGMFFTYPAIRDYQFSVADALPRMPAPMTDTPNCFEAPNCNEAAGCAMNCCPPIPFYVVVNCQFTASPKNGYKALVTAEVNGLISRNTH